MDRTMKENFCTILTRIVEEETHKAKEIKIPMMQVLLLLTALLVLPLLVEMIAFACGKTCIGYWMFLPDAIIVLCLIIRKQIRYQS